MCFVKKVKEYRNSQKMNQSATKSFHQSKNRFIMKTLPITILLVLLCTSACTKNKNTVIEGTVLEYGSNNPIEGAKVEIYRWYSTDILSGGSFFKDVVFTDSRGRFKWESDEDIGREWYEIRYIVKEAYFPLRWENNYLYYEQIRFGDHYNKTMHLDPNTHLYVEDVSGAKENF